MKFGHIKLRNDWILVMIEMNQGQRSALSKLVGQIFFENVNLFTRNVVQKYETNFQMNVALVRKYVKCLFDAHRRTIRIKFGQF